MLLPVVQAIYYSFWRWNGLGPLQNFIGLANYTRAVQRQSVRRRARATTSSSWCCRSLIQLPLALGLALLVRRNLRGRATFRTIFFLPFVLSEVVTGVIWNFIYRPHGGLINSLIQSIIPGFKETALLANPNTVLYALFGVITWKFFGYHMILYIAGLQNIPAELEEAAQIDGCGKLQTLRYITDPTAWQHHPALDLPVGAGVAPVLRPDLGDDHRRAGQRQRYHGNLSVQVRVPALPAGLWQRDRGDYIPDLLQLFT